MLCPETTQHPRHFTMGCLKAAGRLESRDRGPPPGFQQLFASLGSWWSGRACVEKDQGQVLTQWEEVASRWLVVPPVGVTRAHTECPLVRHPELLSNLDAAAPQGEGPLLPHLLSCSLDAPLLHPRAQPGPLSMTWPSLPRSPGLI